jgi:hypothetical protein
MIQDLEAVTRNIIEKNRKDNTENKGKERQKEFLLGLGRGSSQLRSRESAFTHEKIGNISVNAEVPPETLIAFIKRREALLQIRVFKSGMKQCKSQDTDNHHVASPFPFPIFLLGGCSSVACDSHSTECIEIARCDLRCSVR